MKSKIEIFLEDMSLNTTYEFLEYGKDKSELDKIAKKRGIKLPAKDLAVFKGTYAYTDRTNKNGCMLVKSEVEKSLDTLVGKAVDFDHFRENVVGNFLEATLIDDEIICYGTFYKGNFPKDYELVQKLMKNGNLGISFEAWGDKEFTNDAMTEYNLNGIEWAGGALLIKEDPAFDGAGVLEMASEEKTEVLELAKVMIKPANFVLGTKPEEAAYKCSCVDCGHVVTSKEHCNTLKCSKCGGSMRRAERPGPGKSAIEEARYSMYDYQAIEKIVSEAEKPKGEENNYTVIESINFKTEKVTIRYEPSNTVAEIDLSIKPKVKVIKKGKGTSNAGEDTVSAEERVLALFEDATKTDAEIEISLATEVEYAGSEIEESKRIDNEKKRKLTDNQFAVIKSYTTKAGLKRKIKIFSLHDPAHVRNALDKLDTSKVKAILRKLGISIDNARGKILKQARKLNMKDLLERYEGSDEAIRVKMFTEIAEENASLKLQIEAKDTEIATAKDEATKKDTEIATKVTELADITKEKDEAITEIAKRDKEIQDATIKARREELGEEVAKDMKDEDILDDSKYKIAKLEKENAALKDKVGEEKPEDANTDLTKGSKDKNAATKIWDAQKRVSDGAFGKENNAQ